MARRPPLMLDRPAARDHAAPQLSARGIGLSGPEMGTFLISL
jgi:hypothetical protein